MPRTTALSCAALLACVPAARMLEVRGQLPFPPRNETPGGRVRYVVEQEGARAKAYEEMARACGGAYEIVSETDDPPTWVTSHNGVSFGFGFPLALTAQMGTSVSNPFLHRTIDFRCVGPCAPAACGPAPAWMAPAPPAAPPPG